MAISAVRLGPLMIIRRLYSSGQIKVVVFLDENRNGVMDQVETRLVDQVSIGQDISCPVANNEFIRAETDASGGAFYENLEPGKYCVMYM
jgi:hypothetical protein